MIVCSSPFLTSFRKCEDRKELAIRMSSFEHIEIPSPSLGRQGDAGTLSKTWRLRGSRRATENTQDP